MVHVSNKFNQQTAAVHIKNNFQKTRHQSNYNFFDSTIKRLGLGLTCLLTSKSMLDQAFFLNFEWGCGLVFNHCRHPRELVSLYNAAPYRWIPIAAANFDTQFPPQRVTPDLWRCETVVRILILLRAPNPNRHSRDLLHSA
ncbi:hypothetical protein TNCV_2215521 [Trichonephila clavipes]|nr:hypothetical protein TNCV_2215521 [Trichonephila clavipes]